MLHSLNAHNQFNAGEANAMEKFNQEMQNQRDQFNSKNRLIIDQNKRTVEKRDSYRRYCGHKSY